MWFVLLMAACSESSGPTSDSSDGNSTAGEAASPISIVSSTKSGTPCYRVVDTDGAVVIADNCPVEDVSGDVRFEAFETWQQQGVTVVFISPGLRVESAQRFSRDDAVGWTAFVTGPDGVARFSLQSNDDTFTCAVSVASVDCS
ncbi:MAG: hypothetical protein RL238_2159 [Actinomycetota bacterium]|jgi:hypothetical protein